MLSISKYKTLLFACSFYLVSCVASTAMPENHKNALEHLANVYAASSLCDEADINISFASLALAVQGISSEDIIDDGIYAKHLQSRIFILQVDMASKDEEIVCAALRLMYGPEGWAVKNLAKF